MSDDRCPECSGFRNLPRVMHDTDPPHECTNEFHKELPPAVADEPEPVVNVAANASQEAVPVPPGRRPKCPHCGFDGGIRGTKTSFAHGRIEVFIVQCGNDDCRKILGAFQPLELTVMGPPMGGPSN